MRRGVLIVGALALLSGCVGPFSDDSPPYPAAALHARSTHLQAIKPNRAAANVSAAYAALGPSSADRAEFPDDWSYVVGELDFDVPKKAPPTGEYQLIPLDRTLGDRPPVRMSGDLAQGGAVALGWDGWNARLAKRYSWMHGVKPIENGDGSMSEDWLALSWRPNSAGPLRFAVWRPPGSLALSDPAKDLTFALVFRGAHDELYWAEKVTVD